MIECVYQNDTSRMVIVKCIGADHFYREKVVMPTEVFWFEARFKPKDLCGHYHLFSVEVVCTNAFHDHHPAGVVLINTLNHLGIWNDANLAVSRQEECLIGHRISTPLDLVQMS